MKPGDTITIIKTLGIYSHIAFYNLLFQVTKRTGGIIVNTIY
jgi:hypothetical protein